jgi:hypothetical protein
MNAFFGHHAVSMHARTISPCRRATSLRRGEREEEHTRIRIVVLRLLTGESDHARDRSVELPSAGAGLRACLFMPGFTQNRFR